MILPRHCCRRSFIFNAGLAVAFALTLQITSTWAGSTLQMGGNSGTGTDPVRISNGDLITIFQTSGGAANASQPFLLILGIPNAGTHFFGFSPNYPILSVSTTTSAGTPSTGSGRLGGDNLYGGSWDKKTGYAGSMGPSSDQAYAVAGLAGAESAGNTNSSNSYVNWSGADAKYANVSASEFGLYVFEISSALGVKDTVSVHFTSGAIPVGTFAIGYAVGATDGQVFDTPFTESALTIGASHFVGSAPAPPSVVLLALGGLGLAVVLVRARRRQLAAAV